ncbi:MAG: S-layer homology domain-containing protein [Clostridia bacterium]|nr:S-layer homology domain-containing protein [Clostridia bacterium]
MKKFLVLTLAALLMVSPIGFSASALSFSDLAESHWAYKDVQTLVNDGTVSGYVDGSFRPNGTVTRAEFVKMLGAGSIQRAQGYDDVAATHWAYNYIMKSGFPEDGTNNFKPDQPITRGLVAELLWNRGGKISAAYAPSIITDQYTKAPQAAAWVYETGLIQGDDGVNLRLDDTLSRAEAAVLIIRARSAGGKKVNFADTVSPKIIKNLYDGLNLFDGKAYDPDATITNGEMARAALRLGTEKNVLTYVNQPTTGADFDHKYALDLAVVCNQTLGKDNLNAKFADQKATFADTVAAVVYQMIAKSKDGVGYGSKTSGLSVARTEMMNICLTYAKNNGIITLNENLTAPITLREFTILCMLIDNKIGTQTDIVTEIHPFTGKLKQYDHSLLLSETPYGNYQVILKDLAFIYKVAPVSAKKAPAASYNFAREYSSVFTSFLIYLTAAVEDRSGAYVRFTYYPSLVWENGLSYSLRVGCEIVEMNGVKRFSQIFPTASGIKGADTELKQGSVVFFDVAFGKAVSGITVTAESAYVEQIVAVTK